MALPTISDNMFGTNYRYPGKFDRNGKISDLVLHTFCLLLSKFNFWNGDWALH